MPVVIDLDKNKINWSVVNQYLKHEKVLKVLDHWVLSPDHDNLPGLIVVKELVDKIQPNKLKNIKLYRGFNFKKKLQNSLGLEESTDYNSANHKFTVVVDKPTSFTLEESIASSFGKSILEIDIGEDTSSFLRMTDELSAAICKMRNIQPETQREWITVSQTPIEFTGRFIKYTKSSSSFLFGDIF